MFVTFVLTGLMLLSACEGALPSRAEEPTEPPPSPVSPSPEATDDDPTPAEWLEQQVGGVLLGIEKPAGWVAQQMDDGIILAEYSVSMASGGDMVRGIQLFLFVHSLEGFHITGGKNVAWDILDQIIRDRKYIGRAHVDSPHGFDWDGHDAAYYLSNDGGGSMTMLLALAMPAAHKMVVCNLTSPTAEADRIRGLLPVLLETLTVNNVRLDAAALRALPDPLVFPAYRPPEQSQPK